MPMMPSIRVNVSPATVESEKSGSGNMEACITLHAWSLVESYTTIPNKIENVNHQRYYKADMSLSKPCVM